MSDFLLDFRDAEIRRKTAAEAGASLRFCDDIQVQTLDFAPFTLVVTRADGFELWGPFQWQLGGGRGLVALAGRIAMEEEQWESAKQVEGPGGLACKAIFMLYRELGIKALERLNGNFVSKLLT